MSETPIGDQVAAETKPWEPVGLTDRGRALYYGTEVPADPAPVPAESADAEPDPEAAPDPDPSVPADGSGSTPETATDPDAADRETRDA